MQYELDERNEIKLKGVANPSFLIDRLFKTIPIPVMLPQWTEQGQCDVNVLCTESDIICVSTHAERPCVV